MAAPTYYCVLTIPVTPRFLFDFFVLILSLVQVRDDLPRGSLIISKITGDGGRLSLEAETNCIGIAAQSTLELLGVSPGERGRIRASP